MKNYNNDNLIEKWFDFRSDEIETNLNEDDMEFMFCFDDLLEEILNCTPSEKKDYLIELFEDYEDRYCSCSSYWKEKYYYMTGWKDAIGVILKG